MQSAWGGTRAEAWTSAEVLAGHSAYKSEIENFLKANPDPAKRVDANAPSALYKLGLLAEQRGDKTTARNFYTRVIAGYPRSPEADLARQNQQRLRP